LIYIGQGKIRGRLQAHWRKAVARGSDGSAQHLAFASAGELEYSYIAGSWLSHQRLELETDLIAAHILSLVFTPPAQFLGN
jgi:hypothetical protein